jgi:hypothetical protein
LRFSLSKVTVNLSLCLINQALCYEDLWEDGDVAPPCLTSTLDGGEWSASRPGRFTSGEKAPGVGPRAGLDTAENKNPLSLLGIKSWPPIPQLVTIPTELHIFIGYLSNQRTFI